MLTLGFLLGASCGCVTSKTVHVVDATGKSVPNAVVVVQTLGKMKQSTFVAGFTDRSGEFKFRFANAYFIEAFGSNNQWGKFEGYWYGNATNTLIITSGVYTGRVAEYYLSENPHASDQIRRRIASFQ